MERTCEFVILELAQLFRISTDTLRYQGDKMTVRRKIELLSPAKNADIGIEAINHGADAVYIGAPRFGLLRGIV